MKKFFKIISGLFVVFLAMAGIAVAVVLNLDYNEYRYLVEAEVREATGRDLEIRGRMDVDLSLTPSIQLNDVHFANADWGSEKEMASLKRLDVKLDLMPLILDGVVDIHTIEIAGLRMLVEKAPSGKTNLEFEPAKGGGKSSGGSQSSGGGSAGEAGLSLPILRNVDLSDVKVRYKDLAAAEERSLDLANLLITGKGPFDPLAVSLEGRADDIPITFAGELGAPNDMLNADRLWVIDLAGDLAGTKIGLSGGIDEPATGRGMNVFVSVESAEIGTLSRITEPLTGEKVPALGPLNLSLLLKGDADRSLAANDIAIDLGRDQLIKARINGDVADIFSQKGIALNADLAVASTEQLGRVLGQELPDLGRVKAAFKLSGQQERLALSNLDLNLSGGNIQGQVSGTVADLLKQTGIALDVNAQVASLADITEIPDLVLPDLGRVTLTGTVSGDVDGNLAASGVDLQVARGKDWNIRTTGSIANVKDVQGIAMDVDIEIADTTRLPKIEGVEIPDLGKVSAKGRLTGDLDKAIALSNLQAEVKRRNDIALVATGSIGDLMKQQGIDLDVKVKSSNLGQIADIVQTSVPALENLALAVLVSGDNGGTIRVPSLDLSVGKSQVKGHINANLAEDRVDVDGALDSPVLYLADLKKQMVEPPVKTGGSDTAKAVTTSSSKQKSSEAEARVFSAEPYDLAFIRKSRARFDMNLEKLIMPNGEVHAMTFNLEAMDGLITISNMALKDPEAGVLSGSFTFDARKDIPTMTAVVKTDGYPMENLTKFTDYDGLIQGPFLLDINLQAAGKSPAAMAASLQGHMKASAVDALVDRKSALQLMAGGPLLAAVVPGETSAPLSLQEIVSVVPNLLSAATRDKELPEQLKLHCMVADYSVTKGVVNTNNLLLDSKYFTSTGTGTVDLGRETLDLTITPQRLFGVSEVAVSQHVTGTLNNPVSSTDVLGSALGTLGNLLKLPINTMQAVGVPVGEESPCVNLRPSNQKKQQATQPAAQPQQQEQNAEPKKPKEQLKDAGKELLKGLFGG
ncbi:AsmA family protein [Aestuariispira insulae]|nr:AsmA family protein [Aestuariispira insulae]